MFFQHFGVSLMWSLFLECDAFRRQINSRYAHWHLNRNMLNKWET